MDEGIYVLAARYKKEHARFDAVEQTLFEVNEEFNKAGAKNGSLAVEVEEGREEIMALKAEIEQLSVVAGGEAVQASKTLQQCLARTQTELRQGLEMQKGYKERLNAAEQLVKQQNILLENVQSSLRQQKQQVEEVTKTGVAMEELQGCTGTVAAESVLWTPSASAAAGHHWSCQQAAARGQRGWLCCSSWGCCWSCQNPSGWQGVAEWYWS